LCLFTKPTPQNQLVKNAMIILMTVRNKAAWLKTFSNISGNLSAGMWLSFKFERVIK